MAEFKVKDQEKLRTIISEKESATVIAAGSLVALDAGGYIIKAVATSTAIAFCPNGAKAGTTDVEISVGNDFTLVCLGTADAVFARAQRGTTCDIKGTTTVVIDNDTGSLNVLLIGSAKDSGVVGSAANIEARINKPIF